MHLMDYPQNYRRQLLKVYVKYNFILFLINKNIYLSSHKKKSSQLGHYEWIWMISFAF